jgi:hypothetical protein
MSASFHTELITKTGARIQCRVIVEPNSERHEQFGRIYKVYPAAGMVAAPIGNMVTELGERIEEGGFIADRYVEICDVKNNLQKSPYKIKGIGTLLLECAMAQSIATGRNGHLQLTVREDSHLFFYSRGFRALQTQLNGIMSEEMKKARGEKPSYGSVKSLGEFTMVLEESANELKVSNSLLQFEYRVEKEIAKSRDEQRLEKLRNELTAKKRELNQVKFDKLSVVNELNQLKITYQRMLAEAVKKKDFEAEIPKRKQTADEIQKKKKGAKRVSFSQEVILRAKERDKIGLNIPLTHRPHSTNKAQGVSSLLELPGFKKSTPSASVLSENISQTLDELIKATEQSLLELNKG